MKKSGIRFYLGFSAEDGAGNRLRTNIGEGKFGQDTCKVRLRRDDYSQLGSVSSKTACTNYCDSQLDINVTQAYVKAPSIPENTAILARPNFQVVVQGDTGFDENCGTPAFTGFLQDLTIADRTVVDDQRPMHCQQKKAPTASDPTFSPDYLWSVVARQNQRSNAKIKPRRRCNAPSRSAMQAFAG